MIPTPEILVMNLSEIHRYGKEMINGDVMGLETASGTKAGISISETCGYAATVISSFLFDGLIHASEELLDPQRDPNIEVPWSKLQALADLINAGKDAQAIKQLLDLLDSLGIE